ncbi:MAG: hypothetical protein COS84_08255, partial [Armatimonadetes bacterium CG07_land_8_20_14_0_80_40_9]
LPNAPDLTSADGSATDGQIDLVWTAPTENTDSSPLVVGEIAEYYIYRSTSSSGPFNKLTTDPSTLNNTVSDYADRDVTAGTTYYYKMSTVNTSGREGPMNTFSRAAVTSAADVPSAPTGLSAIPGDREVTLSWNANPSGDQVTSYTVERSSDGGATFPDSDTTTTTSYTDNGSLGSVPDNGTLYYYRVSAVNAKGAGSPCPAVSARPLSTTPPPTPAGLTIAVDANTTRIALSWTAILEGDYSDVAGYALYRDISVTGSFSELVAVVTGQASSTYINLNEADDLVHGVVNGVPYYYKITALGMNSAGGIDLSKESERSSAAPSAPLLVNPYSTEPPPAPQWNGDPVGGNLSVSLAWNPVTLPGNERLKGYYVWRDRGGPGEVQSSLLSRDTTSYIDTVPNNEATHSYQIEAVRYGAA